jgi:hypothetical protein
MRLGIKPGQLGWSFEQLVESWRVAEDAGFDLISCFDHVTTAPDLEGPAWDAPSLLSAMAGVTSRIALSVDVVNVALRNPALLAAQVAVAQAASGTAPRSGPSRSIGHASLWGVNPMRSWKSPFATRMDGMWGRATCRRMPRRRAG